jgi:hypothetical protein
LGFWCMVALAVSRAAGDPASFCRACAALTLLGPVPVALVGAPRDLIAAWKPNVGVSGTPRRIVGDSRRRIDDRRRDRPALALARSGRDR